MKKHRNCRMLLGSLLIYFFLAYHPTASASRWPTAADPVAELNSLLAAAEGEERIVLLIRRGETYQQLGRIREAVADYSAALNLAETAGHPLLTVAASQSLGFGYFLEQDYRKAETMLRAALQEAEARDNATLAASCANRLGTVLVRQRRGEEPRHMYEKALEHAERADDPGLTAGIHRNLARIFSDETQAIQHLKDAYNAASRVESPRERTELLLGIGAEGLRRKTQTASDLARDALMEAQASARELPADQGAKRFISQAEGRLGALHEQSGRGEKALALTGQALQAAQSIRAHDLLLLWEWQLGRIFRGRNDPERAIAAYRRAVYHIEAIRQDIPITYQDGRSSFRETLSPIYLGLADLLLEKSAGSPDDGEQQELLKEAQRVLETVKASELRDYFRDPCIAALKREIESLSDATAVFYPIILPDRLELLVNIGGRLERKTVSTGQKELEAAVLLLSEKLRKHEDFEDSARTLHHWLIRPILPLLESGGIDILVYVPDGVLRLLPITALLADDDRFLAERLPVVTTPGLTLLDPAPLTRGNMVTLLAGLSEPGPVVNDLPGGFLSGLILAARTEPACAIVTRGVTVFTPGDRDFKPQPEEIRQARITLNLPGVDEEIQQLSKELPGKVLLNETFSLNRFSSELDAESFRVIHIASHGYFGGTPEENFIMTYDQRLDMKRFKSLIRPRQLATQPVELVTLSACQTAEGDDRSPLGLSGVVLKSGARSALGSLWPVSDEAARILLPVFYKYLKDPAITKAEALRRAQVELLKQDGFQHPFFWSPFILVGNWL